MKPNRKLDLTDVTLCAVDTINPRLAARALDISQSQCHFGDAILMSHQVVPTQTRIVQIGQLRSLGEYSAFVIKELPGYISTPWVLVVQWDGYVVDSSRWSDDFFQYDYIGSRWLGSSDGRDVGNGGFSLRSARLLNALSDKRFSVPENAAEDALICTMWRTTLESDYGIRFAPASVADRFSYEYATPERPSFGFHGPFNMWRHTDDDSMIEIIRSVDIKTLTSPRCIALLKTYCDLRKFSCIEAIYRRLREYLTAEDITNAFIRNFMESSIALKYIKICEDSQGTISDKNHSV